MKIRVYDGTTTDFLDDLSVDVREAVRSSIMSTEFTVPEIQPNPDLYGIPDIVYDQIMAALKSGKRHMIFYGPPGTGKTTLAKYVAEQLSSTGEYEMLTASSSWTSQELIGGYQPIGHGEIGFRPGAILRNFDKPIVIDELNRCPIDKVIGPLFSVLSGQDTTLPYKLNVADENSPFHVIYPVSKEDKADYEWAPGPEWRLIATLNTVDKSQLGQISYALSRRFAWIRIGVPKDLAAATRHFMGREAEKERPNPIADMWAAVNRIRQIGGAPIIDCIRLLQQMKPGIDLLTEPDDELQDYLLIALNMYILPLLDGIRSGEAQSFVEQLSRSWKLSEAKSKTLQEEMVDFIA
jgi:5-methylcytosine-specific restriction protein B